MQTCQCLPQVVTIYTPLMHEISDCLGPFSRIENYNFVFKSIINTCAARSTMPTILSENALYLTFHF